jgi:hypothetical protein
MAIIYMTANAQTNKEKGSAVYEASGTITANTDAIMLPDETGKTDNWNLALSEFVGGASARFEYSNSPRSQVLAGGGSWNPWDNGNVTSYSDDSLHPPTAVRVILEAGTSVKYEVVVN